MKKILQYGSPLLEKVSKPIEDYKDPKITSLINEMLKLLKSDPGRSAGLSAPQVGELYRLAICRRTDLEKGKQNKKSEADWEVMINPSITFKSPELSINWEGCLSINHGDLFGKVERPKVIEVDYIDIGGKPKKLKASDFFSHVVQHEVDHLDGILFLKYIEDPTQLYTGDELID